MTRLADLFDAQRVLAHRGDTSMRVSGVATDSRLVGPGDLFVCLPGYRAPGGETLSDRHDYARQAYERGAVAFLVERDVDVPPTCAVVRVDDTWSAAAIAAARFHGQPSASLFSVGITGTSGKTSTSYFVDAVLRAGGHRVARLGTIDYRLGDEIIPAEQTTPEAPVLQRLLRRAVDSGCSAVVMEVSSHALELQRVRGVHFDVGVFTNLSRDHLNFHPDMASYRLAKARLFKGLGAAAAAVVNIDDREWREMVSGSQAQPIRYGLSLAAEVVATAVHTTMAGLEFEVNTPSGSARVKLSQLGAYNVHNALAAFAVGLHMGMSPPDIAHALASAESVPGRFEVIEGPRDFTVVVDYAHKPDALERVLECARRLKPRRLLTVFGCGGDRDRGKRALMGRIAGRASDLVVVTSDNPRSEEPGAIIDDILVGSRESDPQLRRHLVEVDRAKAIRCAVELAEAGDLVVIAGKGHESYQLVAGRRLDFDDREHARLAVR